MFHWLSHLLGWNRGMVVSEWRLATIEHRPVYYAVAIGFKCDECGKVTGWHLTNITMSLDYFPREKYSCVPVHEL